MPGYALVVDRGHLAPGGELGDAVRYRPPHATGPGEVLARAGVVDRAVRRGREVALQAADRPGDIEVGTGEIGDGLAGQCMHPVAEGLLADDRPARVGVEFGDGFVDRTPGCDLVGDPAH